MKAFVTDAKFQFLQEIHVIHHIKGTEDVKTFLLVREKSIIHIKLNFHSVANFH